ncbi:SlyX family protein [Hoeflea sp. YIM 152468]|uniref:SlyX family protein n=1 Tax=Hoeflea sp. YIM 152468 TaxID=3031759 RepID=UPI0023DA097C|nr:SlyX family protein [Hoeflea sp. YIM 152468]MDF1610381.1 SlyX family protein [Hoeflea sp. YIM 152468]
MNLNDETRMETEARMVRLEELVAHQQAAIEELSRQLTESWKQSEKLRAELARLSDRFQDMEDTAESPPANQPPPHW